MGDRNSRIVLMLALAGMLTVALSTAAYSVPFKASTLRWQNLNYIEDSNTPGVSLNISASSANFTDMFFANGQKIEIIVNITNTTNGAGGFGGGFGANCNSGNTPLLTGCINASTISVTANFSRFGGAPDKRAWWDATHKLFRANHTINVSNITGLRGGIFGGAIAIIVMNNTAPPWFLRPDGSLNTAMTQPVWVAAVVVNMTTMGCPPAGQGTVFPTMLNATDQLITPVGCTQNTTLCQKFYSGQALCPLCTYTPIVRNATGQQVICAPAFGGSTTNLRTVARTGNFSSVTFIVDMPGYSKINFTTPVNMANRTTMPQVMQFAMENMMAGGKIGVNESKWNGGQRVNLNLGARLTIYNASRILRISGRDPTIKFGSYVGLAGSSSMAPCPRSRCNPAGFTYDGQNLTFQVNSFSTYTAGNTNYSLRYQNLTVMRQSVFQRQNITYKINITNNGSSAADTYNLSLWSNMTRKWINMSSVTLNSTRVGGLHNHTQVEIRAFATSGGTYRTFIIANYWNGTAKNTTWSLNSTSDGIRFITTVVPATLSIASPANSANVSTASGLIITLSNNTRLVWCNAAMNQTRNVTFHRCRSTLTVGAGNLTQAHRQNITIWANDTYGNFFKTSVVYNLTFDSVKPVTRFRTPTNRQNVSGTISINMTVTDSTSRVKRVNVTIGNSTGPRARRQLSLAAGTLLNGNWTTTLNTATLSDGRYNITLNVTDYANNVNSTFKINISIDNNAPRLTVIRPAATEYVNSLPINASATDAGTKVEAVRYNITNSSGLVRAGLLTKASDGYYTAAVNIINYKAGSYSVVIVANDTISRTNTSSVQFTVVAPSIALSTPADNANITATMALVFKNNTKLSWCNVTVNSTLVATLYNCRNTTIGSGNLTQGRNQNLTIWANDTSGSRFKLTKTGIARDTRAPLVTIQRPANNSRATTIIGIRTNAIDSTVGVRQVTYKIGNSSGVKLSGSLTLAQGTMFIGNWTASVNIGSLVEGKKYNVTVNATDYNRNSNATRLSNFSFNRAPRIVFSQPHNTTYGNATVSFNITASSDVLGKAFVELLSHNFTMTNASGQWQYLNASMIDKKHTATFWFNDTYGFWNSTTTYFTVDVTAPSVSITLSETSLYVNNGVTITCSASDATSGVASSSVSVRKPSGSTVSATSGASFSSTSEEGTYTVTCSATDNAGNSRSTTSTFTTTNRPTGGGGTGGGGTTPTQSATKSWGSIAAGSQATMAIATTGIEFTQIEVQVKEDVAQPSITVKPLSSQPSSVSSAAPGKVYSYVEVTKNNLDDSKISAAAIKFKVSKQWISNNSVDKAKVWLNRYSAGQWARYAATLLSEDAGYVYYSASVPGFSVFAITGEAAAAPTPPQQNCTAGAKRCSGTSLETCTNGNWAVSSNCGSLGCNANTLACNTAATQPPVTTPSAPKADYTTIWIIVAIIIIVVIVAAAAMFYMKK